MWRVGVLGASFDPPTRGHHDVIVQAAAECDEVLLVPSIAHAFQKVLSPIENRLAMLRMFIRPWQEKKVPRVEILNIETALQRTSSSQYVYTYDLLCAITKLYESRKKPFRLCFIMGPDIAKREVWTHFYRFKEIEEKWPLLIVKERVVIRSTMVRDYIAAAPPDMRKKVIEWVGAPIMHYIFQNRLYQNAC